MNYNVYHVIQPQSLLKYETFWNQIVGIADFVNKINLVFMNMMLYNIICNDRDVTTNRTFVKYIN